MFTTAIGDQTLRVVFLLEAAFNIMYCIVFYLISFPISSIANQNNPA